jgi:hypothetical protein
MFSYSHLKLWKYFCYRIVAMLHSSSCIIRSSLTHSVIIYAPIVLILVSFILLVLSIHHLSRTLDLLALSSTPPGLWSHIDFFPAGPGLRRVGRSHGGAAPVILPVVCCSVHASSRTFFAPIGLTFRARGDAQSLTDSGGRDLNFPFV